MNTHRHELTFTGDVPADEAERAEIFTHPKVKAAKAALLEALAEAGHPHTAAHKITKPKTPATATPSAAPAPSGDPAPVTGRHRAAAE